MEGNTEPISFISEAAPRLSVLVGRGTEARSAAISERGLSIGTAKDNDVVLYDRAVSAHHCALTVAPGGVLVRDLGSRNGTWVDGVRVMTGRVHEGGQLRVGRTDLLFVARGVKKAEPTDGLIAASDSMLRVLGDVERFASLSWPVLVRGESGAGKEGIARALHQRGLRRERPFVAINAGSITRELVESELFGHEKGSFTGAAMTHRGVFEQADTGTLFLDEIGELPLDMQSRLLRVLETWEVRRVGSPTTIRVDVRLVCATHRDLRALVEAHKFRQDLYFRLARLVIDIPPLRARPEDVRALALHFLADIAKELGPRQLTESAMERLLAYEWPGNARELRNVLSGAAACTSSPFIDEHDVDRALLLVSSPGSSRVSENESLARALERHRGNLSATARALGIARSTLRDRVRSLQENEED